jgi:AraC family transcriptional regulator
MAGGAAAGRTDRAADALRSTPEFAIERARDWGQVSVAVFQRGGGDGAGAGEIGVWRNPWHGIVLSPALIGPVAVSFDGGPARRFTPRPGTLGFYPAGAEVSVSHAPGQVIRILQDPALYRGLMWEIGGGGAEVAPIINFADPLVTQIARTLALEAESGPADRLLVDGLSMALAVQVARRFWPCRPPPDADGRGLSRERLRRVLDHIEAHLGDELSLADLAGVACLSPFHFSRCFKQAVGVGPQRYVLRRRVERARDMIRRTGEPLAAIARLLGFADQSHFTNVFRRETGATPARFRAAGTLA